MSAAQRIDLADRLWRWRPHPSQREWLLDEHRVKVAACGRRWGKTESAAVDVATYAIVNNGSSQIIVAPTYDQSKLISRTVEGLLLSHTDLRRYTKIVHTPYTEIRFRKSRIMARTADDDGRNLRGHSADRVIVDEAAFVRGQVIEEVIGPMLADRNGCLVLISTPFGKNHFYDAFLRGSVHIPSNKHQENCSTAQNRYKSFRFPSWENPHISREYIEAQRQSLTERQFKVEYEAEFIDDQSSVFNWEHIQRAINTRRLRNTVTHVAGVDWARYSDYTAVVVLSVGEPLSAKQSSSSCNTTEEPTSPWLEVVYIDRFNRMEWQAQVERVADVLSRFQVSTVAADQTSVGDPLIENLRDVLWNKRGLPVRVEGVVFTNQVKREIIDNLSLCLERQEIAIPYDERLVSELRYYEYEFTDSGHVRMGARRGYHDDCVCAMALALRVVCRTLSPAGFLTSGRVRDSAVGW